MSCASCALCNAERTKNFSGAELEGLVKSAASFALNRQVDVNNLAKPVDESNIKVRLVCGLLCISQLQLLCSGSPCVHATLGLTRHCHLWLSCACS